MLTEVGMGFHWWIGVVESRADPLKLGRLQIRMYSDHTDDLEAIPTSDLPWAQPLQPIISSAMGDIGYSPTGIVEGTWCVGFYMDGTDKQRPIVMGTLAGIPLKRPKAGKGFNDPNEKYPERINEPDVNRLARNEEDFPHQVLEDKENSRETNIERALNNEPYEQPESVYDAAYPLNHVRQTESGHIKEYDDTPNKERIHEYHKTGTFYEIDNEGTKVTRIVKDDYEIVAGDDYAYVKGSCHLTIDANATTFIRGNWEIEVGQDLTIDVGGKIDVDCVDDCDIDSGQGNGRGPGNIYLNSAT